MKIPYQMMFKSLKRWLSVLGISGATMVLLSGCSKSPATGESDSSSNQAAVTAATSERSSNDVVRSFLQGMLTMDQARVEKEIIPTAGAEVLWQGKPIPEQERQHVMAQIETMTIKEFKIGETYFLSRGRKVVVTDKLVGPDRKLVVPVIEGHAMPLPFMLKRIDGKWKVDPAILVAARQAGRKRR